MRSPEPPVARIAVLASGSGSNLGALFDHFAHAPACDVGTIALVASNKPTAGALQRARERGVPAEVITDPRDGDALRTLLEQAHIDTIVLAGYLRLIPSQVIARWPGRMLNVHPALLPAFGGPGMYGARVHEAVVAAGVTESGVTVHFVDEQYDRGAIAAQYAVPVLPTDAATDVAARVLRAEHLVLPRVVEALCAGRIRLNTDGSVHGASPLAAQLIEQLAEQLPSLSS